MYNGKTKSLGSVLWKVFRNKLITDLSYDEGAEYALEFIRLVGAPLVFHDTVKKVNVNAYKAALPTDSINIKGIRVYDYNDNGIDTTYDAPIALRYATDLYHKGSTDICDDPNFTKAANSVHPELTYTLQNGIIFTSFEKGTIEVSYKAIGLDEDGYPLIPDNEKFLLGLEYYILHRYLEGLWSMGKITDKVFSYYEQKRHWYLGAANSSLQMPTLDQLESIMNGVNRIIRSDYWHGEFFRKFGEREKIKKYN